MQVGLCCVVPSVLYFLFCICQPNTHPLNLLVSNRAVADLVGGYLDVDYIKDDQELRRLHIDLRCWDRPAGLRSVNLKVGTFPYGDDISGCTVDGTEGRSHLLPPANFVPGIRYYITVEVEDAVGWSTRRTSDGFTLDLVICLQF